MFFFINLSLIPDVCSVNGTFISNFGRKVSRTRRTRRRKAAGVDTKVLDPVALDL